MFKSLQFQCDDFHLYIFAFDDIACNILKKLNYVNVTVISLNEFEDEELLSIKSTRTKAEYCWTCTPSTILYVINHFKAESCTYIDSDLYFYSNPKVLFDEMVNNSIMITEHRFTKINDRAKIAGIYCVQFITFKNDSNGLEVLNWWRNACNEWCYNRYEDGKFGDQKYLDDWTTRFRGVHVMNHLGGGLAPWNIQQYKLIEKKENRLFFKTKKENCKFEAIFYHFHYVRYYQKGLIDIGWVKIPNKIMKNIYIQYIKEIEDALTIVKKVDKEFSTILFKFNFANHKGLREKVKFIFKIVTRFNLFKKEKLRNK